ncbi:uncharacterized protein LOC128546863 [Mercenaria mercenaria]|uniref:uncharacterized protein LOC128546863 n=1 Tax=Mercenaria mercenaria TaxID=6596 RepID=UPI00234EAB23|nr:uncharacterized protein LOC128546863 [Mercenaria mercenaria]
MHNTRRPRLQTSSRIFPQTTSHPFARTSSQHLQVRNSQSSLTTLLTYCDMKSFCDIKWDVFVPYLFYSGSVMLLTNQIPLNNFNFTRLNYEITKKGEGAIIAGYAVMRTMTLFDRRFRLARAMHDILNNAGFIGDTRKGKARINHFVKKGNFELTWENFSLL